MRRDGKWETENFILFRARTQTHSYTKRFVHKKAFAWNALFLLLFSLLCYLFNATQNLIHSPFTPLQAPHSDAFSDSKVSQTDQKTYRHFGKFIQQETFQKDLGFCHLTFVQLWRHHHWRYGPFIAWQPFKVPQAHLGLGDGAKRQWKVRICQSVWARISNLRNCLRRTAASAWLKRTASKRAFGRGR